MTWLDHLRQDSRALGDFLNHIEVERQKVLEVVAKDWNEYNKLIGQRIALDNLTHFVTMADKEQMQYNHYVESVTGKA